MLPICEQLQLLPVEQDLPQGNEGVVRQLRPCSDVDVRMPDGRSQLPDARQTHAVESGMVRSERKVTVFLIIMDRNVL